MGIRRALLLAPVLTTACGGASPPPPPPPPPVSVELPPAPEPPPTRDEAHRALAVLEECWLLLPAPGESGLPPTTAEARRTKCREPAALVHVPKGPERAERLVEAEEETVAEYARKLEALAARDEVDRPPQDRLLRLLRALAAAYRESRRASDAAVTIQAVMQQRVAEAAVDAAGQGVDSFLRWIRNQRPSGKSALKTLGDALPKTLLKEEVDAARVMRAHEALDALFALGAGDDELAVEAHALAVVLAMDRAALEDKLIKGSKVHAACDGFERIFGVAAPPVPEPDARRPDPSAWGKYVVRVAQAAGHPVPADARGDPEDLDFAWEAVLAGIADKLEADGQKIPPTNRLSQSLPIVARWVGKPYADLVAKAKLKKKGRGK